VKSNSRLNWDEIKKLLFTHFADKRSDPDLLRKFNQLENKKLSVEAFYDMISDTHKALCNIIDRTETNPTALQIKNKLYEATCLEVFVTGLKGNSDSAVRSRNLNTLHKAYEIASIFF